MKLKDSDINHLRRLLGYVRCEIGQSPIEMVGTVQGILPAIGVPSHEGKRRLVEAYQQSQNVPGYVRAAVKALEKRIAKEAEDGAIVEGDDEMPPYAMVEIAPHEFLESLDSKAVEFLGPENIDSAEIVRG